MRKMDKIAFFDRWAASYDWLLPSVFYQAVHVRLLEYAALTPQITVLEIGCGTGKLLNRMARRQETLTGVGVDFSAAMIRQATQKTDYPDRLSFVVGDVAQLPVVSARFDQVFCAISFLHYPEPQRALAEVSRVLRPGGQFYWADFTPPRWAAATVGVRPVTPGGVRFYAAAARAELGAAAGLRCDRHDYLLGPVMLSAFTRLSATDGTP